jgi:hypothetical protein
MTNSERNIIEEEQARIKEIQKVSRKLQLIDFVRYYYTVIDDMTIGEGFKDWQNKPNE